MRRRSGGVTVIEILVAMVLLATGVIFALSAVTYATKATAGTTQSTEATAYARKILEIVMVAGPKGAIYNGAINPPFVGPVWHPLVSEADGSIAPPFELTDFVPNGSVQDEKIFRDSAKQFELKVDVQTYRDPVTSAVMEGLYSVDVQLRWRDRLGPRVTSFPGLYRAE